MKVSCLPVSLYQDFFSGQTTIPQWSEQAQALGLDCIDINALFIRDKSLDEIAAIRHALTIPVLMVSAYSDFTLPDDAARAQALHTALEDMERAAAIGAKYIRLTAGQAYPGEEDSVMCKRVYDCFQVCCEKAAVLGLTILLENHSKPGAWQYSDYNFHLERFLLLWEALKELPISINFDTANAYALTDWRQILNAVAGRIATVHINDLSSADPLRFCLAGDGIVPMEQILDAVYATGFQGDICLEEAAFLGWEGIEKAARYTLQLCKKRSLNNEIPEVSMESNIVLKTRSRLGEGIWWDDRRNCLFWVDIMKKEVHCLQNGQDRLLKTFDDFVGFCAPCEDGRLIVGCGRNLLLFDPDTLQTEVLQTVDEDERNNRFNDAKCTPDGRLLAGTMNNILNEEDADDANTGRLYLLENGKPPVRLMDKLSVSNGIAFTEDAKTVYHVDTYSQTIYAYDYDGTTGLLSNPRTAVKVPLENGNPDGFTIAADGTLFVAHWGGGAIRRYDPATGKELEKWEFPAVHVTCCCFGGENLDELYINTSSIDAPEESYPLAGSIFMVKPGVKGMKVNRFKISN